jgi:hypothetical protein
VFERISKRAPVDLGRPASELIHEERAARCGPPFAHAVTTHLGVPVL